LLAESNCVDIILYSQHHNHASYMNDDANRRENLTTRLYYLNPSKKTMFHWRFWREILKRRNYWFYR